MLSIMNYTLTSMTNRYLIDNLMYSILNSEKSRRICYYLTCLNLSLTAIWYYSLKSREGGGRDIFNNEHQCLLSTFWKLSDVLLQLTIDMLCFVTTLLQVLESFTFCFILTFKHSKIKQSNFTFILCTCTKE